MNTTNEQLLKNILEIRLKKGFSQEYMAENLGFTQPGYSVIERGMRQMDYSLLCRIADVFDMSVIDIITYPDKYVRADERQAVTAAADEEKVTLSVELSAHKREQVLKLVFGANNIELFNR